MKNSIPSDVWERKKSLISKLYKDEEWPLKQVIKKIRSDDFNPSETQLRSRLKKWRVTKPSRQTRKKSHDAQHEAAGNDSSHEASTPREQSSSVSPKTQMRGMKQPNMADLPVTDSDWYLTESAYAQDVSLDGRSLSNAWAPVTAQQGSLSPLSRHRDGSTGSPSMVVLPSSTSYDPGHSSPLVDGVLLDSSTMNSTFSGSPYTSTGESCMQTPAPTTAPPIQWSVPPWYSMALDNGSQPHQMPFFTTAPLSPPVDQAIQMMPHPSHRVYSPHSPRPSSFSHQHMPNYHHDGMKPWQRTVSVPYIPDTAGGHPTVDHKPRQHTPLERKTSMPPKASSQPPVGMVTPPSPFFSNGQHPIMCAPMYQYPGPEPLAHKPTSIDF